jgi:poly-gamma-glutamate synthesis protein (capsule biosynthesis protein)
MLEDDDWQGERFDEEAEARRARGRRRRVVGLGVAATLAVAVGAVAAANSVDPFGSASRASEPAKGGEKGSTAGGAGGKAEQKSVKPADEITRFVVEANGDFLIHSPIYNRALANGGGKSYDFRPMMRSIKPYIKSADLALCHIETPMTSSRPAGYPLFNTPPDLAKAIKDTGWHACDTASNHTLDRGQSGVNQTIRALDRQGIKHTGSFSSAAAQKKPLIMTVKGVKVGYLAYTEMTNGIPLPNRYSVNLMKTGQILADARRAKRAGAQVVIVNLHAGAEYQHRPSEYQVAMVKRLTRSRDIDAIVGQHVHVVQPIRKVNGKFVVYGEGNLISNQTTACCAPGSRDGILAFLHFAVKGKRVWVEKARYVPIWVRHPDYRVLPVGDGLRQRLADPASLRASYKRTVGVIGRTSQITPVPARIG